MNRGNNFKKGLNKKSLFFGVLFVVIVIGFFGESVSAEICEASSGSSCYYVAINGSDSNPGTFEEPFATVQYGVKQISAGDYLYLREGRYYEYKIYIGNWRDGSSDSWYTIKSYPGKWAIIDGNHLQSPAIEGDSYYNGIFVGTTQKGAQGFIRFENLEITGAGVGPGHQDYPSNYPGIK